MQLAAIRDIFVDNLLPILLCAGAGFTLGRTLRPDIKAASRMSFYVFSPCLVFTSLVRVGMAGGEFGKLAFFTIGVSAAVAGLAWMCGRLLGAQRRVLASLVVASMIVNSGNYGLPAVKFAFGDEALARALVCFVFSTVVVYTAGILVASMGKSSARQALRNLLGVPAFYGLVAAGIVRGGDAQVPLFVDRAVSLLSEAAIPVMMVILGLQLAEIRAWPHRRAALIGSAGFLQLVVTPLIGLVLAGLIGLSGPARQAAVLQSAMPAGVVTTVLAVEYELDTELVSGTLLLTTLLSPLTLTPLISYLLS